MMDFIIINIMETNNVIVRQCIEKFNQKVKFYDSYLLYDSNKIFRYKSICEIRVTIDFNSIIYVDICDTKITTIYRCYVSIADKELCAIRIKIIQIFMENMNKSNSSTKQLEEISKKMDAINEKIDAIVYAPGSSLYKEIASKYEKDEKK